MLDHTLARDAATGLYDFAIGPDGDLAFDEGAAYPVISCLVAKRGEWRWDAGYGTTLLQTRNSNYATASQFVAAGNQALASAKSEGYVTGGSADARRYGLRWGLTINYQTATGSKSASFGF